MDGEGSQPIRQNARRNCSDAEVERLRVSRTRVITAADNERRDIERKLHDGLQQDLFAMAVNLQLAERAVDSEPAELQRLLGELRRGLHDAIEGVRSLSRSVYPGLLSDLGLAAALGGLASATGVPVHTEAPVDRFPAGLEAGVYFCCLEAVQAVAGQQPFGPVIVRVWRDRGSLVFEIGVEGLAPPRNEALLAAAAAGIADRVGALGGRLTTSVDGGATLVRGEVSLEAGP